LIPIENGSRSGGRYFVALFTNDCERRTSSAVAARQRLALKHRHYGYRRIGALLRREGWQGNQKRVRV
jgi:hypothetical protein